MYVASPRGTAVANTVAGHGNMTRCQNVAQFLGIIFWLLRALYDRLSGKWVGGWVGGWVGDSIQGNNKHELDGASGKRWLLSQHILKTQLLHTRMYFCLFTRTSDKFGLLLPTCYSGKVCVQSMSPQQPIIVFGGQNTTNIMHVVRQPAVMSGI